MSERAPVTDWLTDWDHLDPRWVEDPFPIWEDIRAVQMPDRPHRPVQGRLSADPLRRHPRHRLRSRALLLPPGDRARQPAARRGRRRAAHHLRPAAPSCRAHGAAAALHAAGRRQAHPQGARGVQRADRCLHRQGPLRRRRRLRPAHPRAPHRPHAGHPRQRRRPVPQVDPRHPRGGHHRPVRAGARLRRADRVLQGPPAGAPGKAGRRPDQLPAHGQVPGRPAVQGEPHPGLAAPAAGGGHRHDLERHRRLALASGQDARRPPAPRRGARADAAAPSRSSCAPTRPSPWRA